MPALNVLHDCATIQLTQGRNTLVDVDDWPELSRHRWYALPTPRGAYYAVRGVQKNRGRSTLRGARGIGRDPVAVPWLDPIATRRLCCGARRPAR
jgi:hypothetical protein